MALREKLHRIIIFFKNHEGFTLVELVVVLGMLGILLISLILTFNPLEQYNKANDSMREHDLGQIQRALDAYFNDTGCYPTSITFGSKWEVNGQVYMEKVPQDPNCLISSSNCYAYITDTKTSCPQWNVLYASLRSSAIPATACPLVAKTSCTPNGYSSNKYNYCVVSGENDCSIISGSTIGGSSGAGTGGSGTGGTGGGVTPTSGPLVCSNNSYYACTSVSAQNPNGSCNSIGLVNGVPTQCSGYGGTFTCVCASNCAGLPCAF